MAWGEPQTSRPTAERYRREGMADAVVLLVLHRIHPSTTAEEWARHLGLTDGEVRAAVQRMRDRQRPRLQVVRTEREQRDERIRRLRAEGWPLKRIAAEVGLSVPRVCQITAGVG